MEINDIPVENINFKNGKITFKTEMLKVGKNEVNIQFINQNVDGIEKQISTDT